MANLRKKENEVGPNPQSVARKVKTDAAKREIDKVLDADLKTELNTADGRASRMEILLTQAIIELQGIRAKP